MATYDGIVFDQSGLSIGDTVAFGTSIPTSTPTGSVVLFAEIFAVQTNEDGFTGSFGLNVEGVTVSDCYFELDPPPCEFKGLSNAVIAYTEHFTGDGKLFLGFQMFAYTFGSISPAATFTIVRVDGTEPVDTGGIRVILRQFSGLHYGTSPLGPVPLDGTINEGQVAGNSGAITAPTFTTEPDVHFVVHTGVGPQEVYTDGFGGYFFISSGPTSIAIDDLIWEIGDYETAFSAVDTASPSATYTVPFDFTDPGGGFNAYIDFSEVFLITQLRTGDNPPECGAPPPGQPAIFASVGGYANQTPVGGGTMGPDDVGIASTTTQRVRLGND